MDIRGKSVLILGGYGLVGQAVDGILGYSPATATNLMARIITYADSHAPAAEGPTTQKSR